MIHTTPFQLTTIADTIPLLAATSMEQQLSKKCSPQLPWHITAAPEVTPERLITLTGAGPDAQVLIIFGMNNETCDRMFNNQCNNGELLDLFGEITEKCLYKCLNFKEIKNYTGVVHLSMPVLNAGNVSFACFSTGFAGNITVENSGNIYCGIFIKK